MCLRLINYPKRPATLTAGKPWDKTGKKWCLASGFVALMRYECGRARDLLRQTDDVLPPEDLRSLYPAEMMAAVYRHLLTRIVANPAAVLNGPLSVADMYKLILAARAWLRCRAEA